MTATLAEYLDTVNAHMGTVRAEYARTKADHAHVDGCDRCAVGADFDRLAGWEFVNGDFLCGSCAGEAKRRVVKAVAFTARRTVCRKGHQMTEANTYVFVDSKNIRRDRCMTCQRKRSQEYKERQRAAKAASA